VKPVADDVVRTALRRVWPDPATVEKAQIRAIGGGVSPRTFLAVAGKQHFVLRMPTASSMALLDLTTEARAMRAAAAADLAPGVVAVDIEAGLLLTQYQVMPWTNEMVNEPIPVSTIVRLLRALHSLPVELPVIAVEDIAIRYLDELGSDAASMSADDRRWDSEKPFMPARFARSSNGVPRPAYSKSTSRAVAPSVKMFDITRSL